MRRASIDIGSNSILLLVAEVKKDFFQEIHKDAEVTALGKNIDKTKMFDSQSMQDSLDCLKRYSQKCQELGVNPADVIVTATEAARVVQNSSEFFKKILQETGLNVRIITGQAEAYFSTKGILFNTQFATSTVFIMDIGGASTELISVDATSMQVQQSISMPVGSVRCTQWLDDGIFQTGLQKVLADFRTPLMSFHTEEIYCVAGTMTSLANMHLKNPAFIEEEVHGLIMPIGAIEQLFRDCSDWPAERFLQDYGFLGKRSKSIKGGLHLAYHLLHALKVKTIHISTYGLRYGTILEGKIPQDYLYQN